MSLLYRAMHSVKSQVKSVILRLKARTLIRPPSMFLLQLEYGFNLHSEKKGKKKKKGTQLCFYFVATCYGLRCCVAFKKNVMYSHNATVFFNFIHFICREYYFNNIIWHHVNSQSAFRNRGTLFPGNKPQITFHVPTINRNTTE
jgi:hypothetical protein